MPPSRCAPTAPAQPHLSARRMRRCSRGKCRALHAIARLESQASAPSANGGLMSGFGRERHQVSWSRHEPEPAHGLDVVADVEYMKKCAAPPRLCSDGVDRRQRSRGSPSSHCRRSVSPTHSMSARHVLPMRSGSTDGGDPPSATSRRPGQDSEDRRGGGPCWAPRHVPATGRHRRAAYPQGASPRIAGQAARDDVGARDPVAPAVESSERRICRVRQIRTLPCDRVAHSCGGGPQQPLEKSASRSPGNVPPGNDHADPVRCTIGRAQQPVDIRSTPRHALRP